MLKMKGKTHGKDFSEQVFVIQLCLCFFEIEIVCFLRILGSLEGTVASEGGNRTSRQISYSSAKCTTNTFMGVREASLGGQMKDNSSSVDMVFICHYFS